MGAKGDLKVLLAANFSQFEKELFEEIVKEGQLVLFPEGELMMDIGQRVEQIPLIVQGTVKVFREDEEDHEIFLYYLKEGEACAITLICSEREGYSKIKAIPVEDTIAIILPIKKLDEWMFKYKSWYYFVMDSYQERFEELLKVVEEIAFHKMDERLLAYLRKWVEVNHSPTVKVTQQQIANELNTSREVVGRLLKKLEQNRTVKIGRNQIEVID